MNCKTFVVCFRRERPLVTTIFLCVTDKAIILPDFRTSGKHNKSFSIFPSNSHLSTKPRIRVNYKPISLLPNFSKFFEKVMYNRLVEFDKTNEIFFLHQFGFRKNHSTLHALIHLVNKISSAIDQRNMKPLQVSFWIFPKRLIPSIMKSYSPSWNTMVSVMWASSG